MRYGWHENPVAWQSAAQAIRDLVWSKHPLLAGYKTLIPHAPGIYLMTLKAANILDTASILELLQAPMYIGKSKNLAVRFTQHMSGLTGTKEFIRNFPQVMFWFAKVNDPEMSRIEAELITVFGPPVNRVQPVLLRGRILSPVPTQM